MRPQDLKSKAEFLAVTPHGIRARYVSGCRCDLCRKANTEYAVKRERIKKLGGWNGLVSAKNARKHILQLAKKGVGRRSISDISGIPESTIIKIKNKERLNIRKATETAILSVSLDFITDATLVDARPVWKKINKLKRVFKEEDIAKLLGYKNSYLQFRKRFVTAKTALRVERFYNRVFNAITYES